MVKAKVYLKALAIANASAAAQRSFTIDTPSDFKTVRGFYVIRNAGSALLKIGVRDAAGNQLLEPVNITHLTVGTSLSIKDRFYRETPCKAGGSKLTVTLENFSTLTAAEDIDFIYECDNGENEK